MEIIRCPECRSDEVIIGELACTGGMVFLPRDQHGLAKESSYIQALACRNCGNVFGFKLADRPTKLTKGLL